MTDVPHPDAEALLESVWKKLSAEKGGKDLNFPKFILWLNGAPGSGKGTHTRFIMSHLGMKNQPVVMSDLLQSPQARELKDRGQLVGDAEVVEMLLRRLSDEELAEGVIVDGFPRTRIQGDVVRHLSKRLGDDSKFHVVLFEVPEEESVFRQLQRGRETLAHNEKAQLSGQGNLKELRKTDIDPEAAALRYRTYEEHTAKPLRAIGDTFPCHVISTLGSIEEVDERIMQQLKI